jgi:hypothetical protein
VKPDFRPVLNSCSLSPANFGPTLLVGSVLLEKWFGMGKRVFFLSALVVA